MMLDQETHDAPLEALRRLAAAIGADRTLVQGAGGNVSLKSSSTMWIKASGMWLAEALEREIFVPVPLGAAGDGWRNAEAADGGGLRPSIETSMHAALPQAVVLHVHSVDAIALAVRADAEALLAERLTGLRWAFVPYRRPGEPLTEAIVAATRGGDIDVLAFANHGLVVAADTVAEADALLRHVVNRLALPARVAPPGGLRTDAHGFRAPSDAAAHAIAIDPISLAVAEHGALYPDHVVFLGPTPLVIDPTDDLGAALGRHDMAGAPRPKWVIVRGRGVAVARDIARGGDEMLRCLADVAARIPGGAPLVALSEADTAALIDWDAEHYRQRMARRAA